MHSPLAFATEHFFEKKFLQLSFSLFANSFADQQRTNLSIPHITYCFLHTRVSTQRSSLFQVLLAVQHWVPLFAQVCWSLASFMGNLNAELLDDRWKLFIHGRFIVLKFNPYAAKCTFSLHERKNLRPSAAARSRHLNKPAASRFASIQFFGAAVVSAPRGEQVRKSPLELDRTLSMLDLL